MKLCLQDGLPCVTLSLSYRGQSLQLENVLVDTGSAGTVLSTDKVLPIGVWYEMDDVVHRIRGVGGAEFVFSKQVDRLAIEDLEVRDFMIEVGAMDYGLQLDGILGTDFLLQVGAVIDLSNLEVRKAS